MDDEPFEPRAEPSVAPASRAVAALILPHTGGQLRAKLAGVERLFVFLATFENPHRREGIAEVVRRYYRGERDQEPARGALPSPFANGEALVAVRSLIARVAADDAREAVVQPLAPDGYKLVPLLFYEVDEEELRSIISALAQIGALDDGSADATLRLAVRAFTMTAEDMESWIRESERLASLLELPWDDASALMRDMLGDVGRAAGEVALSAQEQAAYEKVGARIVRTWHQGDPLEALLYRR